MPGEGVGCRKPRDIPAPMEWKLIMASVHNTQKKKSKQYKNRPTWLRKARAGPRQPCRRALTSELSAVHTERRPLSSGKAVHQIHLPPSLSGKGDHSEILLWVFPQSQVQTFSFRSCDILQLRTHTTALEHKCPAGKLSWWGKLWFFSMIPKNCHWSVEQKVQGSYFSSARDTQR